MSQRLSLAALSCAALCSIVPDGARAQDWEWTVTPYAWIISTDFSTAIDVPEDGEQEASDIFENLDFAAQVHVEGSGEHFGVLLDFTNLQLSDRTDQGRYQVKSDSSTTLVEAALTYNVPVDEHRVFTVLAGMRALNVNLDLELLPPEGGEVLFATGLDKTLADFMFGMRFQWALNDKWGMSVRADVASGDTDFSSNINVGVTRDMGRSGELALGYRYLEVKFERASALLDPTLEVMGPEIGYSFRF